MWDICKEKKKETEKRGKREIGGLKRKGKKKGKKKGGKKIEPPHR